MKQEEINKIFQPVADDELAQALPGVPIVKYEDFAAPISKLEKTFTYQLLS